MANKRINALPVVTSTTTGDVVPIDGATTRGVTVENLLGDNVQSIKDLTSAANKVPYFNGAGTSDVADFTAYGRTIVATADEAAFKAAVNLEIGTDVQAYDADLSALAGLTSAADKLPYFTGSGTASLADFSAFARTLLNDADAATARTTLGLGSAAQSSSTDFATAAQGSTADSAVQPGDLGDLALKDLVDVPGDLDVTGTPDGTKFLRDDGSWQALAGGGDVLAANQLSDVNVIASGTNPVARTAASKFRDVVSVLDFGCVGDDSTDNATALDAAFFDAYWEGYNLYFPEGVYRTSAAHALPAGVCLFGAGKYRTTIKTTSATVDVLSTGGTGNTIRGLGFSSSVPRTAGSFVEINAGLFEIDDFVMNGPFIGITCQSPQRSILIHNGEITDAVVGGESIKFVNTGTDVSMNDMVFTINDTAFRPNAHIALYVLGDLSMSDIQMYGAVNNMTMSPGLDQGISSLKCMNVWFDQPLDNALFIQPTSNGFLKRSSFTSCWFAGCATGSGVLIFPSGASTAIDGVDFNGCEFLNNATSGFFTGGTAGTIKDIQIIGGRVAGNTAQGILFDGVTGGQIQGVRIGPSGGYGGANGTGVYLASATDYVTVIGNDIRGNTTAQVTNAASGTHNRIVDNPGYNPVGTTSYTLPASTATYTAGPTPETHYLGGGTLTNITVNGQGIFYNAGSATTTFHLGPNETYSITYSVAPTVHIRTIH